jgi:hypothetical protein
MAARIAGACAAVGVATATIVTMVSDSGTATAALTTPQASTNRFAPYVDTSLFPPFDLVKSAQSSGVKQYNLAFVLAGGGACDPKWGSGVALADDPVAKQVGALRRIGGDVRLSFGGANGTELALACNTAEQLAAAYQKAIDAVGVNKVDFDIEGAALSNAAANTRRDQAIAALQARNKGLQVSYTLPVLPQGLTQDGINLIKDAQQHRVNIGAVNIMAMDYGDSVAPSPIGRMGDLAIAAAKATQQQLRTTLDLADAAAWGKLAVTPMIGVNDVADEVFNVADARKLVTFANTQHLAGLSMWSATRDRACPQGPLAHADATCSSINQQALAFTSVFKSFRG